MILKSIGANTTKEVIPRSQLNYFLIFLFSDISNSFKSFIGKIITADIIYPIIPQIPQTKSSFIQLLKIICVEIKKNTQSSIGIGKSVLNNVL